MCVRVTVIFPHGELVGRAEKPRMSFNTMGPEVLVEEVNTLSVKQDIKRKCQYLGRTKKAG